MVNRRRRARSKGFTLVELLVVCLIIEILTLVGLPSYLSSMLLARQETANQNAKTLAVSVQGKAVTSNGYDTVLTDYTTDMGGHIPINPCTATSTGYTITAPTTMSATVKATAGTNCGTWSPKTYSLSL